MAENKKRYYFVDEAGDGTLFGKSGGIVIGTEGCSKFFILGVLAVSDPEALTNELTILRQQLLADPYFKKVPSMQSEAKKTYFAFHAKDDVPEVRREVLSVFKKHDLQFLAVIRNKYKVLEYVRQRNSQDPAYRYHPNELYDFMVRILFKDLLHKENEYDVTFAKRGTQDRTTSLREALEKAQFRFATQRNISNNSVVNVIPTIPVKCVPLQAVDYILWSLQRFYEMHEDRYIELLWPSFSLVRDLDDTRNARYGCYYTQKRPLTLAALDNSLPGI